MAAETLTLRGEVFLDTSYLIALAVSSDEHHEKALRLGAAIKANDIHVVTTDAVLMELGSAFSKPRYRSAGVRTYESLHSDPHVSILPLTAELLSRAWGLFADRSDKEWSVTDCLSFIVMTDLRTIDALTTDIHYQQAGFRALLRGDTA